MHSTKGLSLPNFHYIYKVYEGLVYMDFSEDLMNNQGHGNYQEIEINSHELPLLFLAYLGIPSDSGKIHSDVRQRFDDGEFEVRMKMTGLRHLEPYSQSRLKRLPFLKWPYFLGRFPYSQSRVKRLPF
jgi:hypothetical protein